MLKTLPPEAQNGGFPEPPPNRDVRLVAARHDACEKATRVRLMAAIPLSLVRRMRCAECGEEFSPTELDDLGTVTPEIAAATRRLAVAAASAAKPARAASKRRVSIPQPTLPTLPRISMPKLSLPRPKLNRPRFNPQSRTWQLASVGLAGVGVVIGLTLLQGGDADQAEPMRAKQSVSVATPAGGEPGSREPSGRGAPNTKLVRGSSYSLALPAGWQRVAASGGATFAAAAPGGEADVTLWIDEDPELDFPTFISRSLAQLEGLTGSARIVERTPAPTPEATIVRLAADAPPGQPIYEVTLRVSGPLRYYLATTIQPDAPETAASEVELIANSFTPELGS